jgi:hypothetical protein
MAFDELGERRVVTALGTLDELTISFRFDCTTRSVGRPGGANIHRGGSRRRRKLERS